MTATRGAGLGGVRGVDAAGASPKSVAAKPRVRPSESPSTFAAAVGKASFGAASTFGHVSQTFRSMIDAAVSIARRTVASIPHSVDAGASAAAGGAAAAAASKFSRVATAHASGVSAIASVDSFSGAASLRILLARILLLSPALLQSVLLLLMLLQMLLRVPL